MQKERATEREPIKTRAKDPLATFPPKKTGRDGCGTLESEHRSWREGHKRQGQVLGARRKPVGRCYEEDRRKDVEWKCNFEVMAAAPSVLRGRGGGRGALDGRWGVEEMEGRMVESQIRWSLLARTAETEFGGENGNSFKGEVRSCGGTEAMVLLPVAFYFAENNED